MKIDALILAGGMSTRMGGRHKGSLPYHGVPLTGRIAMELQSIADTVYVSYGETIRQDTSVGIPVQDIYPGCGPISGLHAGLMASSADIVVTAPCDMPLLKAGFFEYLLALMPPEADALIPCRGSFAEPLAALYRPSCSAVFERQILTGHYRIRLALDQMNTIYTDISGQPLLTAMLANINRPEDYAALPENSDQGIFPD